MSHSTNNRFKYSDMPDLIIIVNEYIKTTPEYSLYTYIKKLVEGYDHPIMGDDGFGNDKEILDLIKKIDNSGFDMWFLDRFMFNLQLCYYNVLIEGNEINYTPRPSFKEWCDKFDNIIKINSKREKSIQNVIVPYQKRFLERVWNPHTKIGENYGKKKMNELPWCI